MKKGKQAQKKRVTEVRSLGIPTVAGNTIRSPNAGLEVATVYRCVNVISDSLALAPVQIFDLKNPDVKTPIPDHFLIKLLNGRPNPYEAPFIFKKQVFQSLLLSGNAYILASNTEFHLLDPSLITVTREQGGYLPVYKVKDRAGNDLGLLSNTEVIHLKYCSKDGLTGSSPILLHKEVIQSEDNGERYQRDSLDSRQMPVGIITIPETVDEERIELFRSQWSSVVRTGRPAIFEEGAKFQPISMTQEATQFIEGRKYTGIDICTKIFGLPTSKVGLKGGNTYTLEEESQMVIDAILPYAQIFCEEVRNFFFGVNPSAFEVAFNLNTLKRYDRKSLDESLRIGITHGWFCANDALAQLGYQPRADGDRYYVPVNMIDSQYAEAWAQKQVETVEKVSTLEETARNIFSYTMRRFVCLARQRQSKLQLDTERGVAYYEQYKTEMREALTDVVLLLCNGHKEIAHKALLEYVNGYDVEAVRDSKVEESGVLEAEYKRIQGIIRGNKNGN